MPSRYALYRGDQVVIHFTSEDAPPYRVIAKFLAENDERYILEGTVGDMTGHDLFIPKAHVKMIERVARRKED